jgi:hypothetical protein
LDWWQAVLERDRHLYPRLRLFFVTRPHTILVLRVNDYCDLRYKVFSAVMNLRAVRLTQYDITFKFMYYSSSAGRYLIIVHLFFTMV